mmetsp:Transcript_5487/g.14734  ORF Transcript_5487/g.14734 Transcript_5487/m.14734 type:complete len:480 (-) Transcript_5487:51-1490(-)|eukprot:CAMPEP_0185836480 /NCGR_PEP_ID=MMETSP1353-20130828/9810_1 /TAXON_ID=1077150 /ORGANISM="Erythrolobus australicus, Strain CCMP3124" /LENGTH=479 /DNA_ID=CAMNT_0028535277 /DNA_START=64 /DNA_END=1503 /DNA_ORIENTATION=+
MRSGKGEAGLESKRGMSVRLVLSEGAGDFDASQLARRSTAALSGCFSWRGSVLVLRTGIESGGRRIAQQRRAMQERGQGSAVQSRRATVYASTELPPSKEGVRYSVADSIRPELQTMAPYIPILPYEILAEKLGIPAKDLIKLDANENPHGPSPKVSEALRDAPFLHIYPDPECTELRGLLSEYTSVPSEYILVGAGADELIDLLFRALITPGKGEYVVSFPPTFGMYKFDSDVNGAACIELEREHGTFAIPIDKLEALFTPEGRVAQGLDANAGAPKMVFVTSPNNPDGSVVSDEVMRRLLALPTLIILDEAYFEFANDNRFGWVLKHDNLVVLRTFSKWAALAGLRVGYGAFPLPLIECLWRIKQPYNVAVSGQIAACASLRDRDDLLRKVELMKMERERFYRAVRDLEWLEPFASEANYVLCSVGGGRDAAEIKRVLAQRGILIRYYATPLLKQCIRVSMGTAEQMDRLYEALRTL